jgi:hypothetical protein
MMDCRHALQILDLQDQLADGLPSEVFPTEERAEAEAHLESCQACARTVLNRRELDRTIGRVMRAVQIPRGAQQRLLARISEIETVDCGEGSGQPMAPLVMTTGGSGLDVFHSNDEDLARNSESSSAAPTPLPTVRPARPFGVSGRASRRRFLRAGVLLAVCSVVALVGFFGVVWLFAPRWSVDDVSQAMAEIDFETLGALGNFAGNGAAADLASESGWQRLKWPCGRQAKGLPIAPNLIAVYGFDVPETRGSAAIRGLIAVIPRRLIRSAPAADSLATASPTGGYLQARIGESVCVAWQQGDFVYVCLIRGGADSLGTLQSALGEPAA